MLLIDVIKRARIRHIIGNKLYGLFVTDYLQNEIIAIDFKALPNSHQFN